MTWAQFRNGLAVLLAAFPKLEPEEATIAVWYALLRDLDAAAFHQAVLTLCQTVLELYPGTNLVATLRDLACPDPAPSVWIAWGEVAAGLRGASAGGAFNLPHRPSFSHPRIQDAVEALGGWERLALSENLSVERAHFIRAYEHDAKQQAHRRLVAQRLPTLPEFATVEEGTNVSDA